MSFLNRFMDGQPQDSSLQSVVRNLLNLLNSKEGYGSRLRDYGLGDYFGQQGLEAAAMSVMHEILYDIYHYEPRLRAREIFTWDDGRLPMAFELSGEFMPDIPPGAKKVPPLPIRLLIQWDAIHGSIRIEIIDLMTERELAILQRERSLPTLGEKKLLHSSQVNLGAKDVR